MLKFGKLGNKLDKLYIWLKGMWIGATMTVPGVSGGTMAVIVGIYEQLLDAVNGLGKNPGKCIPFLLRFVCGAGIGFLVFARGITFLLSHPTMGGVVRLLFCGIVAGGIPLLVEKSEVKRVSFVHILWLFLGIVIVLLLSKIPQGILGEGDGIGTILKMFAGGFLIAIALILPGISATHMLYILGLYETVLTMVYELEIVKLLPLLAGGICGTFLTAGLLDKLMKRYTTQVYLVIIGFVAGSMTTLFPQGMIAYPVLGILLAIAGCFCMYRLSLRAKEI